MNIFKCTKCGKVLNGFNPSKCECGFIVPVIDGVYQFTDDSPIFIDGDGLKWLGYENVGENYEPGYVYGKDNDRVKPSYDLAYYLGKDKIVLDVGAGLGCMAISFALAGLYAIAADISQVMLKTAIERAKKNNVPDGKMICVRMNGYKLELADHSVDAVYSQDMLHQVDKPELIMEEIKRVLKPDGCFMQYGGKNLYTPEQEAANQKYNEAQKDIESFYDTIIFESGCGIVPFQDWDKARDCVTDNFTEHIGITEWTLKLGLHKTKTRASGSKQLIPDDIHNNAWAKTDEYAKIKYGENYEEMTRYYSYNFVNGMALYKLRRK